MFKIGETFRISNYGKIDYTVVSIIEDDGKTLIVAKHKASWGGYKYDIFIRNDKSGSLYKHTSS